MPPFPFFSLGFLLLVTDYLSAGIYTLPASQRIFSPKLLVPRSRYPPARDISEMHILGLLALTAAVQAAPQRGGGGMSGGGAMLRFGCAQTVIDRIDPYVFFFRPSP